MIELEPVARIQFPSTEDVALEMIRTCEYGARNCYNSQAQSSEDSFKKMIPALIRRGHESPLEHSIMVVELITTRAVMAELTRHRHNSFSIRSQRFVNECKSGDLAFVRPTLEKYPPSQQTILYSLWKEGCDDCEKRYNELKDAGAQNEDARKILTNDVATQIVMSGNFRQWRQVFKLRTARDVYPECREVMTMLLNKAKEMFPCIFDDIVPYIGEKVEEYGNADDKKS